MPVDAMKIVWSKEVTRFQQWIENEIDERSKKRKISFQLNFVLILLLTSTRMATTRIDLGMNDI